MYLFDQIILFAAFFLLFELAFLSKVAINNIFVLYVMFLIAGEIIFTKAWLRVESTSFQELDRSVWMCSRYLILLFRLPSTWLCNRAFSFFVVNLQRIYLNTPRVKTPVLFKFDFGMCTTGKLDGGLWHGSGAGDGQSLAWSWFLPNLH